MPNKEDKLDLLKHDDCDRFVEDIETGRLQAEMEAAGFSKLLTEYNKALLAPDRLRKSQLMQQVLWCESLSPRDVSVFSMTQLTFRMGFTLSASCLSIVVTSNFLISLIFILDRRRRSHLFSSFPPEQTIVSLRVWHLHPSTSASPTLTSQPGPSLHASPLPSS